MTTSLSPLRDEHRGLAPHIDQLRTTADRIGAMPRVRLVSDLRSTLDFLTRHLRPHAITEERVLYPEVGRLMGSPTATATMQRDHDAIRRLTDELEITLAQILEHREITRATQNEARRILYGLHALISLHFEKEESVYIPLMESRLDDPEGTRLLDALERVHTALDGDPHHADLAAHRDGNPYDSPASDADAPAP